ncbi:SDR family NAD(P)-dependent oxidoreductase [Marinigracilibium pacificum]|uniref:SDR family oxidoreductase n=1 Tax=Marinigracilibium pacificum TaxID=2729599 RepID=A0A848J2G8_9BACT|nr:SDR family oxidoreductase [Marinigracilibium pacificum]NMM47382.1 SDR family oxidoreductase [Marinigracilibium pacificum]
MELTNKKIVITGGSAGIGKSFLKEFIARGATEFAIIGRREEPLEKLAKEFPQVNFVLIQGDVSALRDIERIVLMVKNHLGGADLLINNAGVVSAGALEEITDEDIINQININLTGLILLTKKMMPLLKKSNEGAVVNISSGLGYIAMPFYSVYAATKAGVRQFTDALRREYHEYPLHFMTVYPTATDTPMMKNAEMDRKMDDPDMVAKVSIDGIVKKELNVVFGGEQRLKDIKTNFEDPLKIDEKAKQNFEVLKKRTSKHRAM